MADRYEYTNVSSDQLMIRSNPARPGEVFLTVEQRHVEDPETAFVSLSQGAAADVAHQLLLKSGRTGVIVMRPDAPEGFTPEEAAQAFLEAAGSSARVVTSERLSSLEEDESTMGALEAAGVDNWDGYGEAMEQLRGAE